MGADCRAGRIVWSPVNERGYGIFSRRLVVVEEAKARWRPAPRDGSTVNQLNTAFFADDSHVLISLLVLVEAINQRPDRVQEQSRSASPR